MSKKYTSQELKCILKDIMSCGYSYLSGVRADIMEINLTDEEINAPEKNERYEQVARLLGAYAAINDIIHHGHSISLQLFSEKQGQPFIKQCIEEYNATEKHKSDNKKVEPVTLDLKDVKA